MSVFLALTCLQMWSWEEAFQILSCNIELRYTMFILFWGRIGEGRCLGDHPPWIYFVIFRIAVVTLLKLYYFKFIFVSSNCAKVGYNSSCEVMDLLLILPPDFYGKIHLRCVKILVIWNKFGVKWLKWKKCKTLKRVW